MVNVGYFSWQLCSLFWLVGGLTREGRGKWKDNNEFLCAVEGHFENENLCFTQADDPLIVIILFLNSSAGWFKLQTV